MKWVFYCLLLANAGFFAWEMRHLEPPAPTTSVEAPIPGTVNRILLLSELDRHKLRERPPPPSETPPPAASGTGSASSPLAAAGDVPATPPRVCYSVGPLENQEQIDRVGAWLHAHDAESVKLRAGERREVSVYWVYFPPFPTLDEAVQRRHDMQAQGIQDTYIIARGDMANAISLGVYSQKASLERRLQKLRAKGYEPSSVTRYKTTTASWYDVQLPAGESFPDDQFTHAFPDSSATATACDQSEIASPAPKS